MATQVSLTDGAVASAGALAIQTNGTTQAVSISTGQVATLAQNPILTSGTANGVAYLNGSKAVTSGSALTFDGTNFATTGTASATKMIPTGGSATGNGMYLPASNTLAWSNNGSETMRLDSAGNLGLGVTPSAWGTGSSMDVGTQTSVHYSGSVGTLLGKNLYYNAGYKYKATGTARAYVQDDGGHSWSIAASGTAGNAITFTQAMTLDASGRLSLGTTTTSDFTMTIYNTSSTSAGIQCQNSSTGTGSNNGFYVGVSGSGTAGTVGYVWNCENDRISFGTNNTEAARIDSSGNLLVGVTSSSVNQFSKNTAQGNGILFVDNTVTVSCRMYSVSNEAYNAAATAMNLGRNSSTSRSINAAGTVNASGADYAEYMTKAGSFTIAKGDVIGINAEGKLTNVFADAVSFCVKSTDPSYVGGDVWGSAEALGLTNPEQPIKREATENTEAETDEEFAIRQAQYETDKAAFESALEVARQKVDRIAFAGQVPVNVTGATAGQYIIPVNDNGSIKGQAVSNPTFEQYQIAVGKVIAIEQDGRARIIVKVA